MRLGARLLASLVVVAGLVPIAVARSAGRAEAAATQAGERVLAYHVDLELRGDGSLLVQERIEYDFGGAHRHGIERFIPHRVPYDNRYDRVYPIEVLSVTASPGTPSQFSVEEIGSNQRVRIGDPDRTITGTHSYELTYTVEAAATPFPDHDELYWNAIGPGWSVAIERPSARLAVPGEITRVACFSGAAGSHTPCSEAAAAGTTATFSAPPLPPGGALTVVAALPTGAVAARPILEERWSIGRAFSRTRATLGTAAGLLLAVVAGFAWLAYQVGRDRRFLGSAIDEVFGTPSGTEAPVPLFDDPTTPVQFEPPDGLRPGQVGTLVDERAGPLDVTATIVDLAVRGYLRIEEVPGQRRGAADWRLVHLRPADDGLRPYEAVLFGRLFEGGQGTVELSDLKRGQFASELAEVKGLLYDDAMQRGWFRTRPDKVRALWAVAGVALAVVGVGLVIAAAAFTRLGLVPIPVVLAGLLIAVGSRWMPRRTAAGRGVLLRTIGFRRFIEESEAERARFAERQNLFSEYLPYAIVFGATEKWARAFSGVGAPAPTPGWYVSSRPFDPVFFGGSIDRFATSATGTIASTPPGSGGSSGFSGGSAGGGGGGGGGGSW